MSNGKKDSKKEAAEKKEVLFKALGKKRNVPGLLSYFFVRAIDKEAAAEKFRRAGYVFEGEIEKG